MSRPTIQVFLAALGAAGVAGCASGPKRISIYDADGIAAIKSWCVAFAYDAGRYEEVIDTVQGGQMRVIKEGYPPMDLQLREDIMFRLRDAFPIKTVREESKAEGIIRLAPQHFARGQFKLVDVTLVPQNGSKELARLRINNGQTSPVISDNEQFANHCAHLIGKTITEPFMQ